MGTIIQNICLTVIWVNVCSTKNKNDSLGEIINHLVDLENIKEYITLKDRELLYI